MGFSRKHLSAEMSKKSRDKLHCNTMKVALENTNSFTYKTPFRLKIL